LDDKIIFVTLVYTMPAKRKPTRKAVATRQKQSQRQSVVVNVHVPKAAARKRGRRTAGGAQQKSSGANYVVVQPSLAVSNPIPQMYSPTQQADTSFPTSAPAVVPPAVATPAPVSTPVSSPMIEPVSTRIFSRPADVPLSAIPRQRITVIGSNDHDDTTLSDILQSLDTSTISTLPVRDLAVQDILTATPHNDNFLPEIRRADDIPDQSYDYGAQLESGTYGDAVVAFKGDNPMGYGNDLLSTYKTPAPRKTRSDAGMPRGPYRPRKQKPTGEDI
jgi:hypothetical protein